MNNQKCVKEGVKRAQLFSSMNKARGLSYFCTKVDIDEDDGSCQIDSLKAVLEGANKNNKAKSWGKFFITSNDSQIFGFGHVPKSLAEETNIDIAKWYDIITKNLPNVQRLDCTSTSTSTSSFPSTSTSTFPSTASEFIGFVAHVDPDSEMFPFKLCDDIIQTNIDFLKENELIGQESDDGDDTVNFADEAGIEW